MVGQLEFGLSFLAALKESSLQSTVLSHPSPLWLTVYWVAESWPHSTRLSSDKPTTTHFFLFLRPCPIQAPVVLEPSWGRASFQDLLWDAQTVIIAQAANLLRLLWMIMGKVCFELVGKRGELQCVWFRQFISRLSFPKFPAIIIMAHFHSH